MNNLANSLSLALINNENIVVYGEVVESILQFCTIHDLSSIVIDLKTIPVLEISVANQEIIILDNLETTTENEQRQLISLFAQEKNTFTVIVSVLKHHVTLYKRLKECFWFSQYVNKTGEYEQESQPSRLKTRLLALRDQLPSVYQSHEVSAYIYDLIIHIRNHRLSTISQLDTRLHTNTIDKVSKLSKSMSLWNDKNYVTPEYVKLAVRKVCYWLVDWETNPVFDVREKLKELSHQREMIINMLTGEWYGSEWKHVERYMKDHLGKEDESSSTGMSNLIVEDAIVRVRPPT